MTSLTPTRVILGRREPICSRRAFARYEDLFTGKDVPVDVSQVAVPMNGIELQDREFIAAIREGREPSSSVAQALPCYQKLDQLERQLAR